MIEIAFRHNDDQPPVRWYNLPGTFIETDDQHIECNGRIIAYHHRITKEPLHQFCERCGTVIWSADPLHPAYETPTEEGEKNR